MKINFCGFNEETTVGEIRTRYNKKENCEELPKYRKNKGVFDAIFAILLGYPSDNKLTCVNNYVATFYKNKNNNPSTLERNALTHTTEGTKEQKTNKKLKTFIGTIGEADSLAIVYEKLSDWTDWENDERKNVLLNVLAGGRNNMSSDTTVSVKETLETKIKSALSKNKQVIFTGAPGTGKTWAVRKYVTDQVVNDENRYVFVQFHSSYDYTDFVEGLRPVPDGKGGNMFVRMDGTFKAFCRYIVQKNLEMLRLNSIDEYYNAMKDESQRVSIMEMLDKTPYFIIIDEINRGDLSKVFGELMFGLEESYREVHNRFDTQYKNLPTYHMVTRNGKEIAEEITKDCFKDGFFVPSNLYIIGTMNDIDRSVESFDFALRRRFIWVDIKANEVMEDSLISMRNSCSNTELSEQAIKEVAEKIIKMNTKISNANMGLTEAYHIGPAYFKELVRVSDNDVDDILKAVYENRIEPILREYTRGRKNGVEDLFSKCKVALGIES